MSYILTKFEDKINEKCSHIMMHYVTGFDQAKPLPY